MEEDKLVVVPEKRTKSKFRYLIWLLLLLLLLIILIPFLLHVKSIQNWLVDKASKSIAEKTEAKVEVGEVDFSIFKGLILEEVYISDPETGVLVHLPPMREDTSNYIMHDLPVPYLGGL